MTPSTFPSERTVVLTGAASARGIGRAAADRMASEGWSIAILDINAEDAKSAAAEIGSNRAVKAIGVGADVSDEASVDRAIAEIEASLPPIVALANLAGISSPTTFMETTVEEWDKVFAINMRGTFIVSQRVLKGMIERKLGRIVSISSISAQRGGGTFSKVAYSATKAGILGFTRALAREVGEFGITVNAIAPGPIDTDMIAFRTPEQREERMKQVPMHRDGTPEEVAQLVAFLLSDESSYITGAEIAIDGASSA